jgi:hypothetical protein
MLEPSMQAQVIAQRRSQLRSSDFAVPAKSTPTKMHRRMKSNTSRSKGDLLSHLIGMLSPTENITALSEIRNAVQEEREGASQAAQAAIDSFDAESPVDTDTDTDTDTSKPKHTTKSSLSLSADKKHQRASNSKTSRLSSSTSTAIPRSESDPHLATHIAGLLLSHGDDSRTADMKIADHLNSTLCFAASSGNLIVAKRALMYGANIDGVNYDHRYSIAILHHPSWNA